MIVRVVVGTDLKKPELIELLHGMPPLIAKISMQIQQLQLARRGETKQDCPSTKQRS